MNTISGSEIRVVSDNIITSLGFTTADNFAAIRKGQSGVVLHHDVNISPEPFFASMADNEILDKLFSRFGDPGDYTKAEKLAICSVNDALSRTNIDPQDPDILFILSTTKGNVGLLKYNGFTARDSGAGSGTRHSSSLYLWNTAEIIALHFGFRSEPLVISNACISGLLAIITGSRLLRTGAYKHIIVTGVDVLSEFIYAGFSSFKSLAAGPCRPFDAARDGLSLGEGAGTVILTAVEGIKGEYSIKTGNGFSSNDANHISGPSRTGEGLFRAISRASETFTGIPGYISAHGTATPFNDEMEAIALSRSSLTDVPVNSMKGYWGHTLGAAGVIESVSGIYSLLNNTLIKTEGYRDHGVSVPLNVTTEHRSASVDSFMKIASGFGGCNAALIFYK